MNPWYTIANAGEIASPAVLISPDRVRENLRRMIAMAGDVSRLRPHVKTHKLPQIIAMKRDLGIDKFKTSTIAEAEMTAAAGGLDILLAYPCVGPNADRLMLLVKRFPRTRFSTLVDCREALECLTRAAQRHETAIDVFIDLNVGMNRTGITVGEPAIELYRAIAASRHTRAAGLHVYDGHLHDANDDVLRQQAEAAFSGVWQLVDDVQRLGLEVPTVVASGTPTSWILARHDAGTRTRIEVGAGTSVLWDFGQEELTPHLNFLNAAVLLARVISRPATDRICIDLGHKAVASEMPLPRVRWLGLEGMRAVMHSEEHLVIETERAGEFPVGTVLYGIPRHVCPTVALHDEVWCVRDGRAAESWPVAARTRRISV